MSEHEHEQQELGDEASFDEWNHFDALEHDGGPGMWDDASEERFVGDLRPGETIEQRNARLLEQQRQERERDRPAGTQYDPKMDALLKLGREDDPVARIERLFGKPERRIHGSAVKVTAADGTESWRDIGEDDEALRQFLELHAEERGYTLEELRRRIPPGRPTPRNRLRRRVLAEIVATAKKAGAKNAAIEHALGLTRQRISDLIGAA
jgi:hypothetical protein